MASKEEMSYFKQMELERTDLEIDNQELRKHLATTMFSGQEDDNLVKWQLDIKEELERIERLLRKQVAKIDKDGNEYFADPKPGDELFNERGVQEILNILAWYLNKNIILSHFEEEHINMRMEQFGDVLIDFIFNNYQGFGMDTKDKMKHYAMIIMNIVNTVEAAYRRALYGHTSKNLKTQYSVTQTQGMYGNNNQGHPQVPVVQQPKKRRWSPTTWFG